jgi:hypothetical protein
MNDDLHYGIRPVSIGKFRGVNNPRPSDILSANRAANWRDFTALLAACCVLTFGWFVLEWVR